jgi:hypothetical protein
MFGLWYIVFGIAFIAIMAIVGVILFSKLHDKNYALYRKYDHIYYYDYDISKKDERDKVYLEKDKYGKKSSRCEIVYNVSIGTLIICCIALVILIIVSIVVPISAKREVREYEYNKEYIEFSLETVQDDSDYLTITGDIFEYNKWLADVKSRVATFGRFSAYYGLVEDLEPIRLPTKTAD